jgi:branched-subunit amino acid permease
MLFNIVMGSTNLITGIALGMSYGTTTITGIITITTITPMGL